MKSSNIHPRWIIGTLGLSVLALTTCIGAPAHVDEARLQRDAGALELLVHEREVGGELVARSRHWRAVRGM
mgnify:CR=1 FL=1